MPRTSAATVARTASVGGRSQHDSKIGLVIAAPCVTRQPHHSRHEGVRCKKGLRHRDRRPPGTLRGGQKSELRCICQLTLCIGRAVAKEHHFSSPFWGSEGDRINWDR